MKIGVISDIHENFHNLILCLEEMMLKEVEYILCLGDLMNSGVAKVLSIQKVPVFLIWGNNDGEKVEIIKAAERLNSNLEVSLNTYDFLDLEGKKIFISHYNDLATPMANSGLYDAVFYGHTHVKSVEKLNETWVVNPGEISAQKSGEASYAIYDTSLDVVDVFTVENSITLKSPIVSAYLSKHKEALGFRSNKIIRS